MITIHKPQSVGPTTVPSFLFEMSAALLACAFDPGCWAAAAARVAHKNHATGHLGPSAGGESQVGKATPADSVAGGRRV